MFHLAQLYLRWRSRWKMACRWFGFIPNPTLEQQVAERTAALSESEARFRAIFEHSEIAITLSRLDGTMVMTNPASLKMFGYTEEEFRQVTFVDYTHPEDLAIDTFLNDELVAGIRSSFKLEKRYIRKDGQQVWGRLTVTLIRDDKGKPLYTLGMAEDISDRIRTQQALKAANQELERLANLDGLTHVANRRAFDRHLNLEWQRSLQTQAPLSLILCDVDFFKRYNDTYGHLAGDDCLQQIAQALSAVAQHPEQIVARYGGEEFVLILPYANSLAAIQTAEAIQAQMSELALAHSGSTISRYITLSLGIATILPTPFYSPSHLLSAADQALYQAKLTGRNRYCLKQLGS